MVCFVCRVELFFSANLLSGKRGSPFKFESMIRAGINGFASWFEVDFCGAPSENTFVVFVFVFSRLSRD